MESRSEQRRTACTISRDLVVFDSSTQRKGEPSSDYSDYSACWRYHLIAIASCYFNSLMFRTPHTSNVRYDHLDFLTFMSSAWDSDRRGRVKREAKGWWCPGFRRDAILSLKWPLRLNTWMHRRVFTLEIIIIDYFSYWLFFFFRLIHNNKVAISIYNKIL